MSPQDILDKFIEFVYNNLSEFISVVIKNRIIERHNKNL